MYVTKLELWNDTGFVENSAEYPNLSDTLTNPDYTYTDLHPAKEDLFSYFKIKGVSYETLISVSYARVTYNNLSYPVYMWVDSVACVSDTSTKLTAVSCHVDLWRTYLGDASLGYGLITKRIRGTADPIQLCPYRYRLAGDYQEIASTNTGNNCYWIIVNTTSHKKSSKADGVIKSPRTMVVPVDKNGVSTIYIGSSSTTGLPCPTLQDFVSGAYDEYLGVDPDTISSVFISPYPILKVDSGTGTEKDPFVFKTETESTDPVTTTGRVDFKRVTSIAAHLSTATSLNNYYTVYYSDSTSVDTDKDIGSLANAKLATLAFATDAGYPGKFSAKYGSTSYSISMAGTYPLVKLDALTFAGTVLTKDSKLTLTNVSVYTGVSYSKSSSDGNYNITVTASATPSSVTEFTYDGSTWGDYWIKYDPNSIPDFVLKVPSIKGQTVQGVDSYDTKHNYAFSGSGKYQEFQAAVDITTTDASECVLTDLDGNPVFSLPWGRKFSFVTVRPVISATSAVLEIRMDGIDSRGDGTCAVVSLPSVDITSNAYSSYVFSGQREYDITQRKIAAQQALVSAITGSAQNTISTGVMGGLGRILPTENEVAKEAWKRAEFYASQYQGDSLPVTFRQNFASSVKSAYADMYKGGMGGKVAGGAMLGVSLAGAAVDYAAAQYFNGKLQDTEDTLRSKQSESLILAGSGWDWLYYGRMPGFVTLVPDDYSLTNFQNNITYNGITCSEPTADCSAYKDYTGPVQIQNLIVTGDIPVQAKYLIANTYAKGIRMKCVNERPDYDITADTLITDHQIKAGTYVFYNNTEYQYKINCVGSVELREQYIVDAGQKTSITLVTGDTISTLYYNKLWVINSNTVTVL